MNGALQLAEQVTGYRDRDTECRDRFGQSVIDAFVASPVHMVGSSRNTRCERCSIHLCQLDATVIFAGLIIDCLLVVFLSEPDVIVKAFENA